MSYCRCWSSRSTRTCNRKEMECVMWFNKRRHIRKHGSCKEDGITSSNLIWMATFHLCTGVIRQHVLSNFFFFLWKVWKRSKQIYKELSSIVACHLNRLFIIHCWPADPSHLRKTGKVTSRDSGLDKQRPEFTCRISPSYSSTKDSEI